jgi:hypothetical protein
MVLHSDLYAIPAVIGATIATVAYEAGAEGPAFAVLGALVCFLMRLAGIRYQLRVPIAPSEGRVSLAAKDPPASRDERRGSRRPRRAEAGVAVGSASGATRPSSRPAVHSATRSGPVTV